MKQNLLKTLLVAVGLCVGASAWADEFTFNEKDYTIVYSDDFSDADNYANHVIIGNTGRCEYVQYSRTDISGDEVKALVMYEYTNQNASDCYYNLFTSSESGIVTYKTAKDYAVTFDWSLAYGYNQASSFRIKNAAGSELIKFEAGTANTTGNIYINGSSTAESTTFTPNPTYGYNNHVVPTFTQFYTITIWANETDGTKLTMVNQKDATDTHTFTLSDDVVYLGQMQFGSGRYYAGVCIDNIKVGMYSDTEIVMSPTAEITGVDGNDRIVTMTLDPGCVAGTVIKYYTDTESKSDLATYSSPITVTSTSKIYYYAESPTSAVSDEQSIDVECGSVSLNAPTVRLAYDSSTGKFNAYFFSDQSDVLLSPTATYTYTTTSITTPTTATSPITDIDIDEKVTIYTNATGYSSASTEKTATAIAFDIPTKVMWAEDYTSGGTLTTGEDYTVAGESGISYPSITVIGETALSGNLGLYAYNTTRWSSTTGGIKSNGSYYWAIKGLINGQIVKVDIPESAFLADAIDSRKNIASSYYVDNGDGTFSCYVKTNNNSISFNGSNSLVVKKITAYDNVVVTTAAIPTSTYGTIASAYALDCANLPSGLEAYKVSSTTTNTVVLEQVTTAVAAGTGLILKGTAGETYDIPVVATGTDISSTNLLKAAVTATVINDDEAYILKNGEFCLVTGTADEAARTVPAGKAYLLASDVPSSAPALMFVFADDMQTTGVQDVRSKMADVRGDIFDLQGRKVANPTKGLYIMNGKKVMIK